MTGWREVLSREAERWFAGRDTRKRVKIRKRVSSAEFGMTCWILIKKKGSIISTGNCVALHMLSENSSKHSAAGGTDELQMG